MCYNKDKLEKWKLWFEGSWIWQLFVVIAPLIVPVLAFVLQYYSYASYAENQKQLLTDKFIKEKENDNLKRAAFLSGVEKTKIWKSMSPEDREKVYKLTGEEAADFMKADAEGYPELQKEVKNLYNMIYAIKEAKASK